MLGIQDRLLDLLNDVEPTSDGVLDCFEQAYAGIKETSETFHRERLTGTVVTDLQQAVSLAELFPDLMRRVKQHLDERMAARGGARIGDSPDYY